MNKPKEAFKLIYEQNKLYKNLHVWLSFFLSGIIISFITATTNYIISFFSLLFSCYHLYLIFKEKGNLERLERKKVRLLGR